MLLHFLITKAEGMSLSTTVRKLASKLDPTLALIFPAKRGKFEARYVQRSTDYFSAYVSSHSGCTMACKFCHLTATGATSFRHATLDTYLMQLDGILKHYDELKRPVAKMHVNFMARGEPLANSTVVNNYPTLYEHFRMRALVREIDMRMNISTIMPKTMLQRELYDVFGEKPVHLYYSLYSTDTKFRREWMPHAMDVDSALDKLKRFQDRTNQDITFHWALIKNQNDDIEQIKQLASKLQSYNFKAKFNLVRYNPPDATSEEAADVRLREAFDILKEAFKETDKGKSKIVTRVGFDVYAS
jgi:23S rRNA (adenine2503-C2)-methyltransferase